jgi:hypothetical protein
MRLHDNRHIRAMVRHDVGSRVRHSAIGKVGIVLMGGDRVAWTLMLLTGMRRGWLHRNVIRGMVRRSLTRLGHSLDRRILSVERNRVTDRTHKRCSRRGARCWGYTRD